MLIALLFFSVGVPFASAANNFVPAGEITAGELTGPARVAVDEATGNLLVVDTARNRVDVFDSSGPGASLLATIGEADLSGPYGIGIDQTNGDVYVTDPGNELVRRYETDGASPPTYTLDATYSGPAAGSGSEEVGSFASAIAVDPTSGDLLVADRGNDRVSRFDSAGAFVSSFDGADSPDGAFTNLEDLTLSPAGKVFLSDGEAAAGGSSRVLRFSTAGAYEATLRALAGEGDALLAYDAKHTELVVGDGRECFFCSTSVHLLNPVSGATYFDISVPSEQITGLAVDPGSGRLFAASLHSDFGAGPKIAVFAPERHPDLVLNPPEPIGASTVHLSGTVNPLGGATGYHFELSKDGGATWQTSADPIDGEPSAGNGTDPVVVEADVAVEPNHSYLVKLVAISFPAYQPDETPTQSFETAPSAPLAITQGLSGLGKTSATILGAINPYGIQTTYRFEYGLTSAYGSTVPVGAEGIAGNEKSLRTFNRTVTDLAPGTTYHYRVVAKSALGETFGEDRTFTTLGAARAYERVTPADKRGATINSLFGFQAADDGSGLVIQLASATPISESSTLATRVLSRRGPTGWLNWSPLDPPLGVAQSYMWSPTAAVSADFTQAMVISNRALAPGAYEGGGNIYIKNLVTGGYTFVGGAPGGGSGGAYASMAGLQKENMFLAGAPDFDWIVFGCPVPLLPEAGESALYKWSRAGGLEIESRLPETDDVATGSHMRPNALTDLASRFISDDGNTLFFGLEGSEAGIYRRSNGVTTAISISEIPGAPDTPFPGRLDGISRDGRYAFFRTGENEPLTVDSPPSVGGKAYMYRYDSASDDLKFVGSPVSTDSGRVLGVGDDGQVVYFGSQAGTVVWNSGNRRLITTDRPDMGTALGLQGFISESGRYLAYMAADHSIHLYEAENDEDHCVSCSPAGNDGELPAGVRTLSNRVPAVVNDEGKMFFDALNPLVPADHNNVLDVYMYDHGALSLISPGEGNYPSVFLDASHNGKDVFFSTAQGLVSDDVDKALDVYDARIGGGFPSAVPAPECDGEACRGPIGARPGGEPPGIGESPAHAAIVDLRSPSAAQLRTLARGGKAHLEVSVSGPGKVSAAGTAKIGGKQRRVIKAVVKAKGAGPVIVPLRVSGPGLAELRERGDLKIAISVRFEDATAKAVSITLKVNAPRKGGRS